jgi:hypothetical protein
MELRFSVSNSSREPRPKSRSKILPATMLTLGTENFELATVLLLELRFLDVPE